MDDEPILMLSTAPSMDVAAALARGLLEVHLAACVSIIDSVRSLYRWKGEICDDPEVQMLIKTRAGHASEVEAWLTRHHPHEVPELITLPIAGISQPYLAWLREQTTESS